MVNATSFFIIKRARPTKVFEKNLGGRASLPAQAGADIKGFYYQASKSYESANT
ncbi:MAG: hypothetical protein V1892_01685 [bacterium]